MRKYSSNKDIAKLVGHLIKLGWTFKVRSKHAQLISPNDEQRVFISRSPSDRRAYMKIKSDLRKSGFKLR